MKTLKFIVALTVLGLIFSACRKDDPKIDGPSLEELNGGFSILEPFYVSRDSVDFSAGESVYFTCGLSKTSNWKIKITGQTSGAVKEITGTSKTIALNDAIWNGSTSQLPMFRNEICAIQLTFVGESDTLVDQVKITGVKTNSGYVITDFENGLNSGWGTFIQSGANMDFQIKTDNFAPQGDDYLNMAGTVNWDWLIGLINFKASADGFVTYPLNPNGNNVYFNAMVYGEPGLINSIVLFQFQEDENGDGTFTATSDDQYDVEIKVDWVGWKLVSIKYSDLATLVNGAPSTPNGNQQHNPNKIKQINMLHLANPSSGYAKAKLDYIIFTENGPLNP
jgi:hypothetical protein